MRIIKDTINYKTFIKRMEIRRNKVGLTKKELSLAIGYSESYIGRITNGYQNKLSLDAVFKICNVLDLPYPKMKINVGGLYE